MSDGPAINLRGKKLLQIYTRCKLFIFWINESFTKNNLCELVRGNAGDLVEEVFSLILLKQNTTIGLPSRLILLKLY
ncbi:hypothetical protein HN51_069124 [Arachis hypogaea]